ESFHVRNRVYSSAGKPPQRNGSRSARKRFYRCPLELLKVAVDVENQLNRAACLIALDGEIARASERNYRVVCASLPRPVVDRRRARHRGAAREELKVAGSARACDRDIER